MLSKLSGLINQTIDETIQNFENILDKMVQFIQEAPSDLEKMFEIPFMLQCFVPTPEFATEIITEAKRVYASFDLVSFKNAIRTALEYIRNTLQDLISVEKIEQVTEILNTVLNKTKDVHAKVKEAAPAIEKIEQAFDKIEHLANSSTHLKDIGVKILNVGTQLIHSPQEAITNVLGTAGFVHNLSDNAGDNSSPTEHLAQNAKKLLSGLF
jgi:methyl-accepting chemotaxis protein